MTIDIPLSTIHSSAIIHPSAQIAADVVIGPWVIIGPNVVIASGCRLNAHVVIHSNTTLGKNNAIHSFAVVGGDPQDLSYKNQATWLKIGDHNTIREYVTIHRGSDSEGSTTHIGHHNNFLAYSHVAHDSRIGDHVLFINHATIAGHVRIDDYAIIGAFSAVHQFCHVGAYSFVARSALISKDVPPYLLVAQTPGYPSGLNLVALRRNGFEKAAITALKEAFAILYTRSLSLTEALEQLKAIDTPEVIKMLEFIQSSKRGIMRKAAKT